MNFEMRNNNNHTNKNHTIWIVVALIGAAVIALLAYRAYYTPQQLAQSETVKVVEVATESPEQVSLEQVKGALIKDASAVLAPTETAPQEQQEIETSQEPQEPDVQVLQIEESAVTTPAATTPSEQKLDELLSSIEVTELPTQEQSAQ
jgi:hypothetical protein